MRLVSLRHPLCQPNTTSPKVLLLRNPWLEFRGDNTYFQEALLVEPGTTNLEILAMSERY